MQLNNYILSILVQSACVIGYSISALIMSRVKRKNHFTSAAILMAISQIVLGFTLIAKVINFLKKCSNYETLLLMIPQI